MDEDAINHGIFKIQAYFTLAIKTLKLDKSVSKTRIKKIDGLSNKVEDVPVYLLGQLGKNELYKDFPIISPGY